MVERQTVFNVMSWTYTILWAMTSYAQIYLNFTLKNVQGLNLNYLLLSLNGYLAYTIYNAHGYWVDNTDTGLVSLSDLIFTFHSMALLLVEYYQTCYYPRGTNTESKITITVCLVFWGLVIAYAVLGSIGSVTSPPKLSVIIVLGYFKIVSSIIKFLPQVVWNCVRETTYGWSIAKVLFDFGGGFLSLSEVVLRCYLTPDYHFNSTKFGLGLLSASFDVIFIIQHYCLYGDSSSTAQPEEVFEEYNEYQQ